MTDTNNNVATCTALVTIEDNVPPQITCTTDKTVVTDAAICGYQHTDTSWDATAVDGCLVISSLSFELSGATILADAPENNSLSGVLFNSGETTVTWTAIDASGISAQCSYTVTVNDTTAPNVICQNNNRTTRRNGECHHSSRRYRQRIY